MDVPNAWLPTGMGLFYFKIDKVLHRIDFGSGIIEKIVDGEFAQSSQVDPEIASAIADVAWLMGYGCHRLE